MSKDNEDLRFKKPYHFQCQNCGKCCSDPHLFVNVTYSDILRFHEKLGYDINKILESVAFYKFDNLTPEIMKKMVLPPIETQNGPAYLGIMKTPEGRCIFLGEDNKCKIYKARPYVCRTFPFHFASKPMITPDAGIKIEMSLSEKGKEYCPGLNLSAPKINARKWMEIGKKTVIAMLSDVVLIKKWNNAINEGKLRPLAENYIHLILQIGREQEGKEKITKKVNRPRRMGKKKNYQKRVKQRLKQKSNITKKNVEKNEKKGR